MFVRRPTQTPVRRIEVEKRPLPGEGTRFHRAADLRFRDRFESAVAPEKRPNLLPLQELLPKRRDGRTEADALAELDDVLLGGELETEYDGATVTRDAPNVNSAGDTNDKNARHVAAEAQLEANAKLEEARLAGMSPEDRAAYEAVKQRCLDANDPVAALALQKLLFEGKLPGAEDKLGEGTTLDHLAALADESTPLGDGVDRDQLVTDLVQELATPSAINQNPKGTCAPTAIAVQLAMENPAEYARIVAGLAGPDGEVQLAGGATLELEPNTVNDGSGRSQVQRLLAPAFMEMANGDENYTNRTDEGAGAWSDTLDILYEQVMGRPMSEKRIRTEEEQAWAMDVIDTQLETGGTVPVAIEYGTGLHKVLVTGTETIDGEEYVTYVNPWGREERMPRAEFEGRIVDINYDPVRQIAGSLGDLFGSRSLERDVERSRHATFTP